MKKIYLAITMVLVSVYTYAQVPNFATTVGDNKIYGYSAVKFQPGVNNTCTYSTLQYGVGKDFAFGADFATNTSDYLGFVARFGHTFSPWFKTGIHVMPSFDLRDDFEYSYFTGAVYFQGQLTQDGKLFWLSNTWFTHQDKKLYVDEWFYLGYHFSLENGHGITPMIGALFPWTFDDDLNVAAGFYYSFPKLNVYVWADKFTVKSVNDKVNPRVNLGVEFAF